MSEDAITKTSKEKIASYIAILNVFLRMPLVYNG